MEKQGNIFTRLNLGGKLAVLPAVFILGIGSILVLMLSHLESQKMDSMVVHLSSRTRVFQQRYMNDVLMNIQGEKVDGSESARIVIDTLTTLKDGGSVQAFTGSEERVQLPPASTLALQNRLTNNLKDIKAYVQLGQDIIKMDKADPERAALLKRLEVESLKNDDALRDTVREFTTLSEDKVSALMSKQITASLLLVLLTSTLAYWITRHVTSRLNRVLRMAEGIAKGDLRQEKLPLDSRDEIASLSAVFNGMLESLRDLATQNISVARNLTTASAEVLSSVQQQAAATKQQAASVQETTTTMEEIGQSGSQIADRARQVSSTAVEATSIGSMGLQAVQNTNRTMVTIREQVEAVAEKIVTLSERTQAIGEIIATVTDIAEQSNLLALNAAIEAAAAGDQGRSFTVVANEIKNLADQAKESTVRVRSILGDIQSGINSSVMLTEEAVKRVESGKQLAEVAENTILQMTSTSKDSSSAFQQIVGATSQQQIGFEQITLALRAITSGAEQTAASTNQLERAALSLNALGRQLQTSVERYAI